ncbi:MAG: Asp-tRNA(Asn)/Glu-tRNA(Gln) amidotransferase subunit GatC [Candidatus Omnitrophica bacterium]|nr:Asp-tRNA(Asn)/Glu-tRNA(Gln) amidotransferase subunit GatC [Candidatus Omnitrophota bacterium]
MNNPKKIDVAYVAKLARLALSESEAARLEKQLSDILEYIGQLNKVDTKSVEPTSHVLPIENVYRDDLPKPSLTADEALKNAPRKENGFFKVPKIIE